jgi:hypothetical protein
LPTKKTDPPNVPFVYSAPTKNIWFTGITFGINMENNDDWLASNKTWKKWTRIGDGELLSYAGINFQKPKDEEQSVKKIKRRKKINDMKLDNNRKQAAKKGWQPSCNGEY